MVAARWNAQTRTSPIPVKRTAVLLLLWFVVLAAGTSGDAAEPRHSLPAPSGDDGLAEVELTLHIIKIYDVDSVSETYKVEGYLLASWDDPRVINLFEEGDDYVLRYENRQARKALGPVIWNPNFEFINTIGHRIVDNQLVRISNEGSVTYEERFNGTFAANMDFRKYPFDHKNFTIEIESFSYPIEELVFVDWDKPIFDGGAAYLEEWETSAPESFVLGSSYVESERQFSRYTLSIEAKRKSQYYVIRILLPLLLIISVSWVIFWMTRFGNQIATATTLLLTVVAFNFYVSNSLPRLPYITYLDMVIISGYAAIFLAILVVVANHFTGDSRLGRLMDRVFAASRWFFPLAYLSTMIILTLLTLSGQANCQDLRASAP